MGSSRLPAWRAEAVAGGLIPPEIPAEIGAWFAGRGWRVRRHQAEMLVADDAGQHALLVADTGAGKTLAGFLPTLAAFAPSRLGSAPAPEGLHTLYVSPLKALAHDVQRNLLTPITEMGLPITVETRSGDTPSDKKARQRVRPPHVLLTTPESLSLLLSYPESAALFREPAARGGGRGSCFCHGQARRSAGAGLVAPCRRWRRVCGGRRFRPRWRTRRSFAAGWRLGGMWTAQRW